MSKISIVSIISVLMIPLILIFSLYVQFHGEFSAGGGFQAGVIFASAFILYSLVFGIEKSQSVTSQRLMALGLSIYLLVGLIGIMSGANFLDYNVLSANPTSGQMLGIFLVEIGVGLTVANVMIVVFYSFANMKVTKK
jgi:multicomponent Na+:H+ antiporter subunit B